MNKCSEKTADELHLNFLSNVYVLVWLLSRGVVRFMVCLGVPNIQQSEVG